MRTHMKHVSYFHIGSNTGSWTVLTDAGAAFCFGGAAGWAADAESV